MRKHATLDRAMRHRGKALPGLPGHLRGRRRISAKLRALLRESGDPSLLHRFDVEAWAGEWMLLPLPDLNGKSPAQVLRQPSGWAIVERVLERMRGGVCA
jgi:hypothetical protein